jgi:hypothetical protein
MNFEFVQEHYDKICHRAGETSVLAEKTEVNLGEDWD